MNLESYNSADVFVKLESEWNDLLRRSAVNTIFNTWEWLSTWWDVYQPGDLWVITCRDGDGLLVGIAPLFIDDERVVRGIGCEDVTDYFDFIVDADCSYDVYHCLAYFLSEHRSLYDRISICNIPEESPTSNILVTALKGRSFHAEVQRMEVCPAIQLPATWDEYVDSLTKKQRHELRRKLRRANGAAEEIDWYIVDETHDLETEMNRFLALMAASGAEKAEFLQDDNNKRFFSKLTPLLFKTGWLMLSFLTVNQEAVASYFNLDYNNEILVYNSGQSHEKYAHLSTGIILLARNIRYGIENQYNVFNFLRGDEPYKYYLGGRDTFIVELTAHYAHN